MNFVKKLNLSIFFLFNFFKKKFNLFALVLQMLVPACPFTQLAWLLRCRYYQLNTGCLALHWYDPHLHTVLQRAAPSR